ncbi:hypothetical protein CDL12_16855 [Handroanthus impetiginosus]|uniref:Ycf2 N-terminal domain-containing protein n=1 Tax=Handroanthus impetiginosus TaxID=429701 RepID=A0A2G9GZ72_9LAMI|nr:hypothetical protein CDL12_16855 [Handroanthus impetiginosus]
MHELCILWRIRKKHGWFSFSQLNLISLTRKMIRKISRKCFHNLFLSEAMIHRNNESPLISTYLRSTNVRELFYSIFFLLLVVGYLVCTHLFFVSRSSSQLQTEFEKVPFVMVESSIIKNLFLVAQEELVDFLEEIWTSGDKGPPSGVKLIRPKLNINLIDIIDFIPNPINRITFSRNTRHLSHTRKNVNGVWIDDDGKIESWIKDNEWIYEEERGFLGQLSAFTTKKRIDQILLNLTHSDYGLRNEPSFPMIEGYLRYLIDIHNKDLLNYEFNTSSLAQRRVFLVHYQTITSSQTSCRTNTLDFPSHERPFSLRFPLSPL